MFLGSRYLLTKGVWKLRDTTHRKKTPWLILTLKNRRRFCDSVKVGQARTLALDEADLGAESKGGQLKYIRMQFLLVELQPLMNPREDY